VKAAFELGVTHGAVSRQLTIMEEWIGQPLFIREGRHLRLTAVGQQLASRAGGSLTDIQSVCSDLRGVPKRRQISIVSPVTFTTNWLMHRIEIYKATYRDVDIWLRTRMSNEPTEFTSADIVITRGSDFDQQGAPRQRTVLFEEMLTVLCSSGFRDGHAIAEPADILKNPRIASLTRPADWANWLEGAGLEDEPRSVSHRYDHQFIAVHAARAGIGSIVAPINLFAPSAELIAPFPDLIVKGLPYVIHHRANEQESIRSLVSWLASEALQPTRSSSGGEPSA